jgi:GntR family histidine utilization transcriptional repressor
MTTKALNSWQAIQDEVLHRIQNGIWSAGTLLPTETELAEEFDCSRATVSRALNSLSADGLLDRKRKGGTRVNLNPVRKATLPIPIMREEVEGKGAVYRSLVLERETRKPSPAIRAQLSLTPNAPMVHIKSLHMADNQPYAFEDRWVNLEVALGFAEADLGILSANEWLMQNSGFSGGDVAFYSVNAGHQEAENLGCREGEALFVLERITQVNNQPITFVRLFYRPGHRISTTL